jgi:hypothetical protein
MSPPIRPAAWTVLYLTLLYSTEYVLRTRTGMGCGILDLPLQYCTPPQSLTLDTQVPIMLRGAMSINSLSAACQLGVTVRVAVPISLNPLPAERFENQ